MLENSLSVDEYLHRSLAFVLTPPYYEIASQCIFFSKDIFFAYLVDYIANKKTIPQTDVSYFVNSIFGVIIVSIMCKEKL